MDITRITTNQHIGFLRVVIMDKIWEVDQHPYSSDLDFLWQARRELLNDTLEMLGGKSMKQAKAHIYVEVEDKLSEGNERLVSFTTIENAPVQALVDETKIKDGRLNVMVLKFGAEFSLIQLPGETMLGHRNVIVANEQLEFV